MRPSPVAAPMPAAEVVLYSTSCAPTHKGKSDITRIKCLLDAKRVHYEEVRWVGLERGMPGPQGLRDHSSLEKEGAQPASAPPELRPPHEPQQPGLRRICRQATRCARRC